MRGERERERIAGRDGGVDLGDGLGRVPTFWVSPGRRRFSFDAASAAAAARQADVPAARHTLGSQSLISSKTMSQIFTG